MAKYTKEQVNTHKRHITIAEMTEIAKKYGKHYDTIKRALWGEMHYDTGGKQRQKMIKEATDLIHKRIINDMKVITDKTVK